MGCGGSKLQKSILFVFAATLTPTLTITCGPTARQFGWALLSNFVGSLMFVLAYVIKSKHMSILVLAAIFCVIVLYLVCSHLWMRYNSRQSQETASTWEGSAQRSAKTSGNGSCLDQHRSLNDRETPPTTPEGNDSSSPYEEITSGSAKCITDDQLTALEDGMGPGSHFSHENGDGDGRAEYPVNQTVAPTFHAKIRDVEMGLMKHVSPSSSISIDKRN